MIKSLEKRIITQNHSYRNSTPAIKQVIINHSKSNLSFIIIIIIVFLTIIVVVIIIIIIIIIIIV